MKQPESKTPALARGGRVHREIRTPNASKQEAREQLETLTDRLELMADWRDALLIQLKRAALLFDLGLFDDEALNALTRRVRIWRDAADALSESLSEANACSVERRAA